MNIGKINSFLVISLFLVGGCIEKQQDGNHLAGKKISLRIVRDTLELSDIFDKAVFYSLHNEIIGAIKEVYYLNNKRIVRSNSGMHKLFIQSENDRLKPFVRIGRGANELNNVNSVSVNNQNIYVLDYIKGTIHRFNESGKKRNEYIFPFLFESFGIIDEDYVCTYSHVPQSGEREEYGLKIFNLVNNKIVNQYFKLEGEFSFERAISPTSIFYSYNDTLCFLRSFDNTVYSVTKDGLRVRYLLENSREVPESLYNNRKLRLNEFVQKLQESDYIWGLSSFSENRRFIFTAFNYHQFRYLHFYDKDLEKTFSGKFIVDDVLSDFIISNSDMPFFYPVGQDEESISFAVIPYYWNEKLNDKNLSQHKVINPDLQENLLTLLKNSGISGNQIIIKYFYKR